MRTYDHDSDALGRRTKVANTGTAFSTNRFSLWTYNDRSELLTSKRYDCNTSGSCLTDSNTNSPVSGQQFTYTFDNIGNRTQDSGDPDANTTGYTANNLNQYTATTSPTESFTYDNDGNLTQDALWDYAWDAENRLITVTARNPTSGSKKLGFDYDHMNRRVRKRVYTWNTFGLGFWNSTPSVDRKFVYDGWNLIEELNGQGSDAIITRFTWGLDLSGQSGNASVDGIHGAGGIGGLLACNDNSGSKNYIYFYNANGDVGQLMDVAGGTSTPAVKYEYYPYGGELLASGLAALVSPFRFSTKYWDAETQNLYYGYRYLRPKMGRWVSRDPLGVGGGLALYAVLNNAPIGLLDFYGQSSGVIPPALQTPSAPKVVNILQGLMGICERECNCRCECPDKMSINVKCYERCIKGCQQEATAIDSALRQMLQDVTDRSKGVGYPLIPNCRIAPARLGWMLSSANLQYLSCSGVQLPKMPTPRNPKGCAHTVFGCRPASCPVRREPPPEGGGPAPEHWDVYIDPTMWNNNRGGIVLYCFADQPNPIAPGLKWHMTCLHPSFGQPWKGDPIDLNKPCPYDDWFGCAKPPSTPGHGDCKRCPGR